jgi:hypothetical protein
MIQVEVERPSTVPGNWGRLRTIFRRRDDDFHDLEPFDQHYDGDALRQLAERVRGNPQPETVTPAREFEAIRRLAQNTCGIYAFFSPVDGMYIELRAMVSKRFPWSTRASLRWTIALIEGDEARRKYTQAHIDTERRSYQ